MPQEPSFYLLSAAFALACFSLMAILGLRGWRDWIDYKRAELDLLKNEDRAPSIPNAASRIEVADLKERVKKLEAIAAGIDL